MDKTIEFFIGLYVKATYARRALAKINKLKLGDIVFYKGKRYHAIQGVQDPYWDIFDGHQRLNRIHKSELKLQAFYKRFWFSFTSTYQFFKGYWYQIDVKNRGRFMFKGN